MLCADLIDNALAGKLANPLIAFPGESANIGSFQINRRPGLQNIYSAVFDADRLLFFCHSLTLFWLKQFN
jgi:hypothetical protein